MARAFEDVRGGKGRRETTAIGVGFFKGQLSPKDDFFPKLATI